VVVWPFAHVDAPLSGAVVTAGAAVATRDGWVAPSRPLR